ncbi:MAG: MazG nucleotide pyrophosphohydrolase domain-containing protein, partial [SAR86 cluster bacterium]|nr:MazG nucleotide pyrophosphohydrolase domain-containing protein [SAR86 cluster bacterium]
HHKGIFEKIKEETNELEQAIESGSKESMQEEVGDLLMILTNLAQSLNVDSEEALRCSNEKFLKRFSYIEEKLIESKREFKDTDLSLLDELWDESKKLG